MLSTDPDRTKDTILCKKPVIAEDEFNFDSDFLDKMISSLGLINSIYNRTYEDMFGRREKKLFQQY